MMSTEEGLTIDNAVVILQVIRDGEHTSPPSYGKHSELLEMGSTSPPWYGKHSELVREACWILSTPLATNNLQNIMAE